MIKMFVPITRVHEEDGSVFVEGYATRDAVDDRGTAFDYEGATEAFAEWTDKFERLTGGESMGNIREMHGKVATGKCVGWRPDEKEKGQYIVAEVIDEGAKVKCMKHVYTGFSIGANPLEPPRMEKRNGKSVPVYHKIQIVEVSLVDNGGTPGTEFTVVRRALDPAAPETPAATAPTTIPPSPTPDPVATDPAPPAASPAAALPAAVAVPAAPTPDPAAPVLKPAPVIDVLGGPPLAPAAAARVAVVLKFDAKKFMPEAAANWARAHDFLVRTAPELETNATHIQVEQRNARDYAALQAVPLADGVELVTGELKTDSPAARFGEILRLVEAEIVRSAQSQEYTILPSLSALANLCQAISSVMYSSPMGDLPETAKGDVASLTAAAEAILDFISSRLGEQLTSLTSGAERMAQSELERFTQLPRVLSRGQLERLMSDDASRANVESMHELGHALCQATMKMGGACSDGQCTPAETEEERLAKAVPAAIPRAGFPSPQEVGLRHSTGSKMPTRMGAPAAPAPAAAAAPAAPGAPAIERASSPTGNDQVLQALGEVVEQVKGLATRIDSVNERVAQVASSPAPIGRPPAAPVDKSIAGFTPPVDRQAQSDELQRLAETMPDPRLKTALLLHSAALVAPGAQPVGQGPKT